VLVITNNGRAAGVLVSPSEYDRLTYTNRFLSSVREGISDVEEGRTYSTVDLLGELQL
jgi:PHD/YefM family antitoxin component YafN of YafNO toxin-antitoxin module